MEQLQQSQRLMEVQKKIELFNDYWCQTLKPKNKLIDISFKRQILRPEPIVRSKGPILTITLKQNNEEESEEHV